MKEFGAWFSGQGKGETEEVDNTVYAHCIGCGKSEFVTEDDLMEDGSWYCNGSDRCIP